MRILQYIAIGLVVGCVSGALGIGGGILLIPALIWICHFDQKKADDYFRRINACVAGLVKDTLRKWEMAGLE